MHVLQVLFLVSFVACLPQRYQRYYPRYGGYNGYQQRKPFTAFNNKRFKAQPQPVQLPVGLRSGGQPAQFSLGRRTGGKIDVEKYVNEALNTPFPKDGRINAPTDLTSPSAAAALAYMKNVAKDGLCGLPTEVYLQTIFGGKSKEEANAEATRIYIEAYNSGERLPQSGACAASDAAWREAWRKGDDPVLESALAFINAWPGAKEGNPCAVSGIAYVKAILDGKTHLEANRISMTGFAKAFKELAEQGKPLKDAACRDATKAFFKAIPEKPDPANAAAFYAFADKIFDEEAPAYDPVCLASLEGFIESYASGDDLLTANLKSARSFFKAFVSGSAIPADSPCAAATVAYANEILSKPSAPNAAGMLAYITEAIAKGDRKIDPVCGAATIAYWDAYIEEKSEAAANEAAAVAYLETLDKNPDFDQNSACAKAAEAYISEFNS